MQHALIAPPNPHIALYNNLPQGALQQTSSCHFTDGKSVVQRECGISQDICQTGGKVKT